MLRWLDYYLRRPGYYFSVAIKDILFGAFIFTITLKLFLFNYLTGLETESSFPSLGIILAISSFSIIMRNANHKFAYLFSLNVLFSMLLFVHSLYYKYFEDFASIYDLKSLHQVGAVFDVVLLMINKEIFFLTDIILWPFLFLIIRRKNCINFRNNTGVCMFLLILGISLNLTPLIYSSRPVDKYFESIYDRTEFVRNVGFINYQAIDMYYFFFTNLQKKQISQSEVHFVKNWFQKKHDKIEKNKLTGIGKGLNLIIIQVESLQNFVVGMKWQGNEVTPNLNRLLKIGMYYKQIYDQTSAGNTSDATFLVNCSLYPARKGAVSFLYAQNSFYCLPKVLNEYGYTTVTMQSYKKSFWNSATFDRTLGFQHQYYGDQYVEKEILGGFMKGLSDKLFFTQSLEKLKMVQAPFYAFLITLSSHSPFAHITPDIDDFPLNKLENTIIGYYMRAIHYVDSAIGDFLKQMEEHNLMSNTVIVIYGDHRARIPKSELRRIGIYDQNEERKIPLLIYIPNHKYGYKSETIGGLIDIAPTICNILGIGESDKYFMGNDLSCKNDGYVIYRDGTFICGEYCSVNEVMAKHDLLISDLVLEKNIIPLLTK